MLRRKRNAVIIKKRYIDELKVIKKRAKEDLLIDKIAVNKQGQPKYCITQPCDDCIFNGHCTLEAKKQWLEQGYVEPEQQVDWSKIKVDTPIYVRDKTSAPWVTRKGMLMVWWPYIIHIRS